MTYTGHNVPADRLLRERIGHMSHAVFRLKSATKRILDVFSDWWHHCLECEADFWEEFEWNPDIPPAWWFATPPREHLGICCIGLQTPEISPWNDVDPKERNPHPARTTKRDLNRYLLSQDRSSSISEEETGSDSLNGGTQESEAGSSTEGMDTGGSDNDGDFTRDD